MAYKFKDDESLSEGFLRCAGEQLDHAVSELSEGMGDDPIEAVHSARKAIKKERSLLRLARGSMSANQRRRENLVLRDAARELSAARDADAMIGTLDRLADRYVGRLPERAFREIREQLERPRDEKRGELIASTLGTRAVGELGAVRLRVENWKLTATGWKAIEDGLRRSYRDGRRAFAGARSDRSIERWHEWRKRAKDLWYQQRLLAPVAGPTVAGQAKDAHLLSDLLGDEHDLGVLRETLARGQAQAPVDVDAVVRLIDHHRDELQAQALCVGARVYAEKPKAFIRRMRRIWNAGRGRIDSAAAQRPIELAEATPAPQPA
jgi:CHAD domain-containing protein